MSALPRLQTRAWCGPRSLGLWLALAAILGVGAYTHLGRLDLIEFKSDEAQVAGLALAGLHKRARSSAWASAPRR